MLLLPYAAARCRLSGGLGKRADSQKAGSVFLFLSFPKYLSPLFLLIHFLSPVFTLTCLLQTEGRGGGGVKSPWGFPRECLQFRNRRRQLAEALQIQTLGVTNAEDATQLRTQKMATALTTDVVRGPRPNNDLQLLLNRAGPSLAVGTSGTGKRLPQLAPATSNAIQILSSFYSLFPPKRQH